MPLQLGIDPETKADVVLPEEASEPELVLLPIWRFDVVSKADGQTRSLWIEGAFGSAFREAP